MAVVPSYQKVPKVGNVPHRGMELENKNFTKMKEYSFLKKT